MKSFFLSLLILSFVLISTPVFAQTTTEPTAIITWQTNTYIPAWYGGKALPTKGSKIDLAVMLIDSGKVIDVSSKKINWYVNEALISSGVGATSATFLTDATLDKNYSIRASIQGYNLKNIEGKTGIRTTAPKLTLRQSLLDTTHVIQAIPFFFNTQTLAGLTLNWILNGATLEPQRQAPAGYLELDNLSAGTHTVESQTSLKSNPQEQVIEKITFTIQ